MVGARSVTSRKAGLSRGSPGPAPFSLEVARDLLPLRLRSERLVRPGGAAAARSTSTTTTVIMSTTLAKIAEIEAEVSAGGGGGGLDKGRSDGGVEMEPFLSLPL